jgi:hypothetical protein
VCPTFPSLRKLHYLSRLLLRTGSISLGIALTLGTIATQSAFAAAPTNIKGSYFGKWLNNAGTTDGKLTFKIKSQKRSGAGFQVKGEGKFGSYRKQSLQGFYTPAARSMSLTLYHASRSAKFHSIGLVLGDDNKTWSGAYNISSAGSQNLGEGTVVVKKK